MYFNPKNAPRHVLQMCRRCHAKMRLHKRLLLLSTVLLVIFYAGFITAPSQFPRQQLLSIETGSTVSQVADFLEDEQVIKSPFLFKSLVALIGGRAQVVSGDYFFEDKHSLFSVVRRMTKGFYGISPRAVTLPEGSTAVEMAHIFADHYPYFDTAEFLALAKDDEGFLFPDTYHFLPNVEAAEVYHALRETFDKKMETIADEFAVSPWSEREIVIMASLLEEEARTTKSRRMVAGVLWNRIEIGMRLQVDAVFPYINGKNTFQLSLDDLQVDSPYNTYKYAGLPIGPITNPSLDAILAALNPIESSYFFYLSDMEGNMHYAVDFEQHKANKFKYLR